MPDGQYPSSWRVFLVAIFDMLRIIALPLAAICVFVGVMVSWPGPLVGLAVLLVVGWLCQRGSERIDREHHW